MERNTPLVRIEPMQMSDLPTVAAIEQRIFSSPWSPHAFAYDLRRRREAHYLVARYLPWALREGAPVSDLGPIDRSIMGYAGAWFVIDECHIATLGVRPEWRGRGVGELLLSGLLQWAAGGGALYATLEVRVSNLVAQRLYAKYGLQVVGRRRRYYADNNEDALLMTTDQLGTPAYAALLDERQNALLARLQQTLAPPPALQSLEPVAFTD